MWLFEKQETSSKFSWAKVLFVRKNRSSGAMQIDFGGGGVKGNDQTEFVS